jgi:hypothetical protein
MRELMRAISKATANGLTAAAVAVGALFLAGGATGCSSEERDPCDPTEAVALTVTYEGASEEVSLASFEGTVDGDFCLVPLEEVVAASGVIEQPETGYYDFVGLDGFQSTSKRCERMEGSLLSGGWADMSTGSLQWDPGLDLFGCYYVKEARDILVFDSP